MPKAIKTIKPITSSPTESSWLGMVFRPKDWPGTFIAYVVGEYKDQDQGPSVKLQFLVWDDEAVFDLDTNEDGSVYSKAQAEGHIWWTSELENACGGWHYVEPSEKAKKAYNEFIQS
jgi:hypothetical protein